MEKLKVFHKILPEDHRPLKIVRTQGEKTEKTLCLDVLKNRCENNSTKTKSAIQKANWRARDRNRAKNRRCNERDRAKRKNEPLLEKNKRKEQRKKRAQEKNLVDYSD